MNVFSGFDSESVWQVVNYRADMYIIRTDITSSKVVLSSKLNKVNIIHHIDRKIVHNVYVFLINYHDFLVSS